MNTIRYNALRLSSHIEDTAMWLSKVRYYPYHIVYHYWKVNHFKHSTDENLMLDCSNGKCLLYHWLASKMIKIENFVQYIYLIKLSRYIGRWALRLDPKG